MSQWTCFNMNNFPHKSPKRRRYTKPCDNCAASKIKCDTKDPCGRCVRRGHKCVWTARRRVSSGFLHADSTDHTDSTNHTDSTDHTDRDDHSNNGTHNFSSTITSTDNKTSCHLTLGTPTQIISKQELLPFLQIYKIWYYGNWPILPTNELIKRLNRLDPTPQTVLTEENLLCYCLCCAVAGAIANQLTFLHAKNPINYDPTRLRTTHRPEKYITESVRARNLINYRLEPKIDHVLISFFYYIYYVNIKNGMSCGLMYMKEAVNFTQLLRLHDPNIYHTKNTWEIHTLTKFYYMLLISERYMSIEQNLPVSLAYSIPLPDLELDENPSLLLGFNELVKSFALPSRSFFDTLINYYSNKSNIKLTKDSWTPTKSWLKQIHGNLNNIEIHYALGETQSMNVIVSKHWMRSLVWNIGQQTNLLSAETDKSSYVSVSYPIIIAEQFLTDTEGFTDFAFESNGPGLCVKLLEIANGVADSINLSNNLSDLPLLQTMFNLVSKYKSDITIPQNIYLKVQDIIIMKSSPQLNQLDYKHPEDSSKSNESFNLLDTDVPSMVASPYLNLVEINMFSLDSLQNNPNSLLPFRYNAMERKSENDEKDGTDTVI